MKTAEQNSNMDIAGRSEDASARAEYGRIVSR